METEIKLAFVRTFVQEMFEGSADCVLVKDSMAAKRKQDRVYPEKQISELPFMELEVVIPQEKARVLKNDIFRRYLPLNNLEYFERGDINSMEFEINLGDIGVFCPSLRESGGLINFLSLKDPLKWCKRGSVPEVKEVYGFNGTKMNLSTRPNSDNNGMNYMVPPLCEGKFFGGDRCTFLLPSIVLYEREAGIVENLRNIAWKSAIEQMMKEYGLNPEPHKASLMNTFDLYHRQKEHFPLRAARYLLHRTKEELESYRAERPELAGQLSLKELLKEG